MAKLEGVLPALVTPLGEDGGLDRRALERLLDHVLAAPVAGVCPAGTTGEGALLSSDVRVELTMHVAARVPRGGWVIPGVMARSADEALREIERYAGAGAGGVLIPPPWYYPLRPPEVLRFYQRVADRCDLPLVLYNFPAMTKVSIPPAVVGELAGHPRLLGIKDSSRDMEYFSAVVSAARVADGFAVMTGSDTMLLASLTVGGAGTIAASVNVIPHLVCRLYEAYRARDMDEARAVQERVAGVVGACRAAGVPAAWKAALSQLGLCSPWTAHPLLPPDPAAVDALGAEIRRLGVTEAQPESAV